MTVEEIEIIVTAKVEEALKEFQKILPTIKQSMKQAQEAFSKVDTKTMTNKLNQAVNFMKKKMQEFKRSTQNNEIAIKVNNKDAQKQISQIQKQIDSLQEKINARQMKLNMITPKLDEITNKTAKAVTPEGVSPDNQAIQNTINNSLASNKEYNTLLAQESKMTQEIAMYNKQLDTAKSKMAQLSQQTSQTATTQNKMSSFFGAFKQKIEQAKPSISNMKNSFSQMPKLTQNITNNIKNMGTGVKNGLGHILKYAGALLSLRGIYSTLSSCANTWLSSQNAGAKQLSANIDYMKYAMGSAFAPVIQWVTNLVYQLMKAIQSVVYALFKVNIFANASAKSYASMAGSAKKAKQETKQLAGIHDEINNIQDNGNSDSGSGGGGGTTPSFDLSGIDNQMLDWINNIKEKLSTLFEPIQNAWNNYGTAMIESAKNALNNVWELVKTIGKSFKEVWLNGTGETTVSLLLQILTNIFNTISAISNAWTNAWNNNGNGTAIIQNLWNALNNILEIINDIIISIKEWWKSDSGQAWANSIISIFATISGWIDTLTANFKKIWDNGASHVFTALSDLGSNLAVIFDNITQAIDPLIQGIINLSGDAFSGLLNIIGIVIDKFNNFMDFFLGENTEKLDAWSIIIGSLATAIGLVVGALTLWNAVQGIWNIIVGIGSTIGTVFAGVMAILTSPITLVIVAITALIAVIVSIIVYWDEVSSALSSGWEWIKQKAIEIFTAIGEFFKNIWQGIKDTVVGIWNAIVDFVVGLITKWIEFQKAKFEFLKSIVVTVFTAVKDFIANIWNGIANTISNVWNTIVSRVKQGVSGAWTAITSVFGNISGWFRDKFSQAWQAVKNVFSTGGAIFEGIKDGILSGLKSIVNAIIRGINKVISIPFNGINSALRSIKNAEILGIRPFSWINTISIPQIPQLAKGGVLYDETLVMAGEYSGASSNPEIVTPQNIMEDTFDKVMSRYQGNNNDRPINLAIYVGNTRLGQILLNDLRDMKRQTGKDIEAIVGG